MVAGCVLRRTCRSRAVKAFAEKNRSIAVNQSKPRTGEPGQAAAYRGVYVYTAQRTGRTEGRVWVLAGRLAKSEHRQTC